MSFLILMFHRARRGRHGNPPEVLDAHFAHIARTYNNVLPGERLDEDNLNVCLSFDDGYFDFFAVVFPLLRKHRLRALLAIPPGVIRDGFRISDHERLQVDSDSAFANPESGGFCTWPELAEMAASGHVSVAAHGFNHQRLDQQSADLTEEIVAPKAILAKRLGQTVDSFVFPFGRYAPRSLAAAEENYRHVLRIGGATNFGRNRPLLYRVDADGMKSPEALFAPGRLALYGARHFWNRLRGR